MNLTFDDAVFRELTQKKVALGLKKNTTFNWETYFMTLAKIKNE